MALDNNLPLVPIFNLLLCDNSEHISLDEWWLHVALTHGEFHRGID